MKKILLLSVLILFIFHFLLFTSSAQSWQKLMDSTNSYIEKQDFRTALKWGKKALAKSEKQYGRIDTHFISSLRTVSEIFYYIGNIDSSIYYGELRLNLSRNLFKNDNPVLENSINNMAVFYDATGNYEKAEPLFKESLDMSRRLFKDDNPDLATSINNMAVFYYERGKYAEAEPMYREALEMRRRLFKGDNPELAASISNMAYFFNGRGKFVEAEPLFVEALKMRRIIFKGDHLDLAASINNLAAFCGNRGRYAEAEPLYKEALDMYRRLFKGDHQDLAICINNMAFFYDGRGRYYEAEPLYKEALEMRRRLFKEDNHELAESINNLAAFYKGREKYAEAESMYKEALEMMRRIFKGDSPELAHSINNMASFYNSRGQFTEAEPLFDEGIEMSRRLYNDDHPLLATSIRSRAYFLYNIGRYSEAEELFKESLTMIRRLYNNDHLDLARSINSLASFYNDRVRYSEAEPLYLESIQVYDKMLRNYFPSLSENEKDQFLNTFKDHFEQFYSFAINRMNDNPSIIQNLFNNRLFTKGLLLSSTQKVRNNIISSGNRDLLRRYEEWLFQKNKIARLYSQSNQQLKEKGINLDSIIKDANNKEKELSKMSGDFAKEYEKKKIVWENVKKLLKPDESAVEIVRFRLFEKNRWTDTVYYAVLILSGINPATPSENSCEIRCVLLKNGNELENKYINNYKTSILNQIKDEISYSQFFAPIAKELNGIKKVYISSDGIFNQLNLQTLFNPETEKYLIDELNIQEVTCSRDIVEMNTVFPNSKILNNRKNIAELFGDPVYNLDNLIIKKADSTNAIPESAYMEIGIIDSLMTRGGFAPLPQTRKEIDSIYILLNTNGWEVKKHLGNAALEESLKSIKNPRVLHIATHGVFLKDIDKSHEFEQTLGMETKSYVENPLLKSMLLFAGADNTISKKGSAISDARIDDGLFTAYEAMNLNLDNTDLVVLSACETGLGEIRNGEGVYGLQRALLVAGAKSLIMSLWKVNDEATQKLMTSFYTKWLSGKPKRQSFKEAQLELKEEHPDPFFWGAFVMVGE